MTRHTAPCASAGPEAAAGVRGDGVDVKPPKIPVSVLVVIHTPDGQVLLLERADRPAFWQSVTGSLDTPDEDLAQAAAREVFEETGFEVPGFEAPGAPVAVSPRPVLQNLLIQNRYEIYEHWRHRYAPGVTHNTEHVFALRVPSQRAPRLAPREHRAFAWLPWCDAVARCFSPSNAAAIQLLADRLAWPLPHPDVPRSQETFPPAHLHAAPAASISPERASAIAPEGPGMGDNGSKGACR